jgi:hydrogenase-4 component E
MTTHSSFSSLAMTGASAMLLCALVVLWRRHVPAYISAFRWQSYALGFVGFVVAWRGHVPELFVVAGLIIAIKGVAVPRMLRAMEARFPSEREQRPLVNTEVSLLISGCLAVLAYEISRPLAAVVRLPTRGGLPIALALILVSLFAVVSRRLAITQIIGFLMLENGIALLALLGAYGVPLVVELGVFLDVLLGVLVMQILVYRIHETFASVDVEQLNRLKH